MSKPTVVRRWDLDERSFFTDNGITCCARETPGIWFYKIDAKRSKYVDVTGQCCACHRVISFRVDDPNPDIWVIKAAHRYAAEGYKAAPIT